MQRSLLLFQNTLKSNVTVKQYTWYLDKFIEFYKLKDHDSLTTIDPQKLQIMIEDYIMDLKKRYSPNSIPMFYYPLQSFFEANDVDLKWRKIKKLFPKKIKVSGEEAYSTKDIQKMLNFANTLRNKTLIHFLASTGVRIGAIPDLKLKHLFEMPMGCKSVLIYEDSTEEYYTFLTPEASKILDDHIEKRRKDREYISEDSPVIRTNYRLGIEKAKPMTVKAIQGVIWRCVNQANVSRSRKGKRFSKQNAHGFRKRFNTILKLNREINPNIIEKMMGHKKGLDGAYLKPTKEEMFEEFKKGIVGLSVNETEKHEALIESQKSKISELERNQKRIEQLETKIVNLQTGFEIYDSLNKLPALPTKQAYELFQKLKKGGIDELGFVFEDKELEKEHEKKTKNSFQRMTD